MRDDLLRDINNEVAAKELVVVRGGVGPRTPNHSGLLFRADNESVKCFPSIGLETHEPGFANSTVSDRESWKVYKHPQRHWRDEAPGLVINHLLKAQHLPADNEIEGTARYTGSHFRECGQLLYVCENASGLDSPEMCLGYGLNYLAILPARRARSLQVVLVCRIGDPTEAHVG